MLSKRKKWSNEEKLILWDKYNSGDTSVYSELLESYIPLVEIIATKAASRLPNSVEIGDLISDGFFGLADAVQKFDSSKGYRFETYASGRIWGEIYDKLRDYDWVSRYSRLKFKQLNKTIDILLERLQREPTIEELCDELNWTTSELHKVQTLFNNSYPVNIDDYITDSTHENFSLSEVIKDSKIGDSEFDYTKYDIIEKLSVSMFSLNEQESVIMYLHHYEDKTFISIATELGIGASRISQIYNDALKKIQNNFT